MLGFLIISTLFLQSGNGHLPGTVSKSFFFDTKSMDMSQISTVIAKKCFWSISEYCFIDDLQNSGNVRKKFMQILHRTTLFFQQELIVLEQHYIYYMI